MAALFLGLQIMARRFAVECLRESSHGCNSRGAPVIDQTGLRGLYNFKSARVVTADDFKTGESNDLLTEAVPEMGLKLTKAPGKIENLVIDSAELPTQN